jgi:hypothetical protein
MYNEERKMRFVEEMGASKTICQTLFNATSKAEKVVDTDLCELPTEAIQAILDNNLGIDPSLIKTYIKTIQRYIEWCDVQHYPVYSKDVKLTINMDEKIRRLMVSSPQHLEAVLNKVFDPVSMETTDCLYRCFFWLAFAGFKIEETMKVKVSEVDFDLMQIHHNGKSLDMCIEAVPAFKLACNAQEFVYIHPLYEKKTRKRCPGELLMRGIRSSAIQTMALRDSIRKKNIAANISLSYERIFLSGIFYKAYMAELHGVKANFDDIVIQRLAQNKSSTRPEYVAQKIRKNLILQYTNWKNAFSVDLLLKFK